MFHPERYIDIPNVDLLTWTFGNANYDEDKPLYIDSHDPSKTLSRREATVYIKSLIAGLHAWGLQPGDSVCLHSFNNIYYSAVYLAIIGARGCFVGSNPAYTTLELGHLFSVSKVKFLIVQQELIGSDSVLPAANGHGIPFSNIFRFDPYGTEPEWLCSFVTLNRLLDYGHSYWYTFDDEKESRTTTAALMSTSGTTGLPKAAAISHFALVAQNTLLYDSNDKQYQITRLLCLPQFHAFACPLYLAPLREGHTTYVMKKFDISQFYEYTSRYSITETTMVTPIVMGLLKLPSFEGLATLRFIWCGGAPLDAGLQNRLISILHPDAIVSQVWGMTEMGWITTFRYPERDDTGSVGRLLPNMEGKIVKRSLIQMIKGENAAGHILIRGPSIMTSYLGNTEATQSAIVGGWLHTGDIGYQRRGKWYISDRAKELIKVRGWQVSPTELEACLLTHQNIMDAAVIGIDFQDGRGELPRAYVVVDQGSPIFVSDSEIQEYVLSRLAKFKALDGGIKRVESIPRSSSGKILKKILREEANLEIMEGSKARNEALPKVERENRRATNLIRGLRGTLRLRNKTQ